MMDKLKATRSLLRMRVTRRMKTSTTKHCVEAVVEITTRMSFGFAATYVRGGSMGSVLRSPLQRLRA